MSWIVALVVGVLVGVLLGRRAVRPAATDDDAVPAALPARSDADRSAASGVESPRVERDADRAPEGSSGDEAHADAVPGQSDDPDAADADDGATHAPEGTPAGDVTSPGTRPSPPPPADGDHREALGRIRRAIEADDERIQRPDDLLAHPAFADGVDLLASPEVTSRELVEHLGSAGYVLPSMAACALTRRNDVPVIDALQATVGFGGYPLRFLLDWLQGRGDAEALPLVLRHAREWWWESLGVRQRVRDYLQWADRHPPSSLKPLFDDIDEPVLQQMRDTLRKFKEPAAERFVQQLDDEIAQRKERRVLGGFGRVAPSPTATPLLHAALERQANRLVERLMQPQPKSIVLSGELGVGKTVLANVIAARLQQAGWLVFEASGADVLAGQKYIGELEGRVREMLGVLSRGRSIWRVQDLLDLLTKGAHSQDPRGILDLVLPALERRELVILGEATPRQLSQLLLARPNAKHLFDTINVEPADAAVLDELSQQWLARHGAEHDTPVAEPKLLEEARRIATQFFPEQQEPGRTLRLLDETLRLALEATPPQLPLTTDHLLGAVAARSGLPLAVIDDRQSLDLDAVREILRERVMGQDEAIDALVDRISMLKAGLADPNRPVGVFLFAGPTGTGKTELAKALGELLFGSDERLLRLDMSEYQGEDGVWRLLGSGDERDATRSLTAQIREQPFSVVLLDEFEKAHPKVWDLFLQVFDDGRLTDRSGHVADFRHSIIILTSNVGSTVTRNAGPGFTTVAGGYSRSTVERAVFDTFRREFINRLDRMVLFNPLDRTLMRSILQRELGRVLDRRGLRNRGWAIEWEPSAIEFLLDRGFTPDLGARPLRRAIDQHLLSPLARTIVEHKAPAGDQFLFVRSSGPSLDVEFIDPAPPSAPDALALAAPPTSDGWEVDVRDLVADPTVSAEVSARLQRALAQLQAQVHGADWVQAGEADLAATRMDGFWQRPDRHLVLDRIDRRDRIHAALDAGSRLAGRLAADGGNTAFVSHLAQLLWMLGLAVEALREQRPQDALVAINLGESSGARGATEAGAWWQRVVHMYQQWGDERRLRVDLTKFDAERCEALLAVSGFGALDILRNESGLHVLESERDGDTRHLAVHVAVAPDLPGVPRGTPPDDKRVCRRYREAPTALVRDSVRGWTSGRIDRVLAGGFDVIDVV